MRRAGNQKPPGKGNGIWWIYIEEENEERLMMVMRLAAPQVRVVFGCMSLPTKSKDESKEVFHEALWFWHQAHSKC